MKVDKGLFSGSGSMTVRILSVIIVCALILIGCTDNKSEGDGKNTVTVYYSEARSINGIKDPLVGEKVIVGEDGNYVDAVLGALWRTPEREGLVSALPAELTVERWENSRGKLSLWLSEYYLEMTGIGKTIATAALAHSMCGLEEVDSLTIYVGNTAVHTDLTKESILLYDKEADQFEREVKVFFSDAEGEFLYDYTYIYTVGGGEIIERYVMDVLLGDTLPEGAVSYIPSRTVVNDIYVDGEICTVDLSAGFYEGRPENPVTERVVIYSIVNTLTSIAGIHSVQFLIDGEKLDDYVSIPLDNPLERNQNIIGGGKKVSVYMWSKERQALQVLPAVVTGAYTSKAGGILGTINTWIDEAGYTNPVPAGTRFFADPQVTGDLTVIDLSAEFHGSPAGESAENMNRAIKAVALAMFDAFSTGNIKVISEGENITIDGVNLSETVIRR